MLSANTKAALGIAIFALCAVAVGYTYYKHRPQAGLGQIQELSLSEPLPPNIPPASCPEWQTQSTPILSYPPGIKCKVLGGARLCPRAGYPDFLPPIPALAGTLDIGPIAGKTQVNQPIPVFFRLRDFGSGDAVVYSFGKVDWGDGAQQQILPFLNGVTISHTYHAQQTFIIHAMAGQQFKYSTPQVGGTSGSYEACQDNSIPVTITP